MHQANPLAAPPRPARSRVSRKELLIAFSLAVLSWNAALDLGIWLLPLWGRLAANPWSYLGVGVLGSGLAATRARALVWVPALLIGVLVVLVASTPLPILAARRLVRADPLQHADAVYVLGSGVLSDGKLPDSLQVPLVHAYEILGQGYAKRLLISRLPAPTPSALPAVQSQLKALHLAVPVEEVGPVWTTFDEARQTAALCRARGWKRVIVVSHPGHMRRVAAVFSKAGVAVICSPCTEGTVDLATTGSPGDRLKAFGGVLHEIIGYQIYHLRGRI